MCCFVKRECCNYFVVWRGAEHGGPGTDHQPHYQHPKPKTLVLCCVVLCCTGFKKVGNAGLLDTVGVSADAAMTKMRLMALLMLGSKASGAPVAFTDIQAALDITPEQVRRGLLLLVLPLLVLVLPFSGRGEGQCHLK
jgi:hypothetical protein